jgi:hypothetical protein
VHQDFREDFDNMAEFKWFKLFVDHWKHESPTDYKDPKESKKDNAKPLNDSGAVSGGMIVMTTLHNPPELIQESQDFKTQGHCGKRFDHLLSDHFLLKEVKPWPNSNHDCCEYYIFLTPGKHCPLDFQNQAPGILKKQDDKNCEGKKFERLLKDHLLPMKAGVNGIDSHKHFVDHQLRAPHTPGISNQIGSCGHLESTGTCTSLSGLLCTNSESESTHTDCRYQRLLQGHWLANKDLGEFDQARI